MDLGGKCDGVALKQTVSYSSDPKLAINGSLKGGDGKVTNTNPSYAKITSLETTLLLHLQPGKDKDGVLVDTIKEPTILAFGTKQFKIIEKIEVDNPGGQVEAGVTEYLEIQASTFVKETDVSTDGALKETTILNQKNYA